MRFLNSFSERWLVFSLWFGMLKSKKIVDSVYQPNLLYALLYADCSIAYPLVGVNWYVHQHRELKRRFHLRWKIDELMIVDCVR